MGTVEDVRMTPRANGLATILAIGTANPSNCVPQETYPDYYFRVTNSEHMTELKNKFRVVCEKSMTKQRYFHLTEDILKENPNIASHSLPSLDARMAITLAEVPKLGQQAAEKAIGEWGQPKSKITHLIFCTITCCNMPGPDCTLTNLLGLSPSVKRFTIYNQGCGSGGTALRMAKDLAENNAGARVLVVCSDIYAMYFRGPSPDNVSDVVAQALFGDGAAAVIVGSDPAAGVERPIFELAWAVPVLFPNTEDYGPGIWTEAGILHTLHKYIPAMIGENVEKGMKEAVAPLRISDWNSLFWIVHPAGRAVLDKVEEGLSLLPEKLACSRHVMTLYGNMISPTSLFVMDEMRKTSALKGLSTTGEGLDWGVFCAFGPGTTMETIILRSFPTN
uniref:chalcone synthase n=1 Tax=Pogostemon cablin TaxID=28511 RepID=A0A0C5CNH3_POGCB|nr:chalcone synthase-like protein [Pogostemon cablin]